MMSKYSEVFSNLLTENILHLLYSKLWLLLTNCHVCALSDLVMERFWFAKEKVKIKPLTGSEQRIFVRVRCCFHRIIFEAFEVKMHL